jgi:hypothetical protein
MLYGSIGNMAVFGEALLIMEKIMALAGEKLAEQSV